MKDWKILRSYGVSPWRYKLLAANVTIKGDVAQTSYIIAKHRWKSTVEYIKKGEKTNG